MEVDRPHAMNADASLRAWVGHTDSVIERVSRRSLELLAATLDVAAPPSDAVPLLWHWLLFVPDTPTSKLGPDGHPPRGGLFPDVPPMRRMFGAGEVHIIKPLWVGEVTQRTSRIASVREKQGRSGDLIIVDVHHLIEGDLGGRIQETQTILYADGNHMDVVEAPSDAPSAEWETSRQMSSILLFRFSALTFNSHRIHYDYPYATGTEGYADLVVQGPLIALLLAELGRARGQDWKRFRFRAKHPIYASDLIELRGDEVADEWDLRAYRNGALAMQAFAG